MLKILHSGDWHVREKDLAEVEKCLMYLVERARTEKPDLIIIAGDLSDSEEIRMKSLSAQLLFRVVTELSTIAPVSIITGTPSHDGDAPLLFSFLYPKRVHVSAGPEQIYLMHHGLSLVAEPGVPMAVISCMPAVTKQFFQSSDNSVDGTDAEIGQAMTQIFTGFGAMASLYDAPHILVGHWNVSGAYVSDTQILTGREIEVSKDQVAMANADLVCLGHIHLRQQIGMNIFFSGSIFRKDFGELDEKGLYFHTIGNGLRTSEFVQVPTRKLVKVSIDTTKWNEFDPNRLKTVREDIKDAIVQYVIRVYTDDATQINQSALERDLVAAGAIKVDVQLHRIPRETVRCERILQLETLPDKIDMLAETKGDTVPDSIREKALLLETESPERVLEIVSGAAIAIVTAAA